MRVEGGETGCQRLFDELGLRAYSDLDHARVHRLTVDTYALQHPERYCRSAKSFAAHLTGLSCFIEREGSPAVYAAVNRWLSGSSPVARPAVPAGRGALTIGDLSDSSGEPHPAQVERWARSTWDAYRELHSLARSWIDQALASPTP